jgi:O-antigen ligase
LYYPKVFADFHLQQAHNDYLQLLAEGGVLVTLPVVATAWALFQRCRRGLRFDRGAARWIRGGAIVSILTIALQSLVEFSLQMPGNTALFIVLLAIVLHRRRGAMDASRERRESSARYAYRV